MDDATPESKDAASPQSTPSATPKEGGTPQGGGTPQVPASPETGFDGPIAAAFALGLALLLLTGLFTNIIMTSDDPGEGLVDTTVWFGWIAGALISLSLIAAGYFGKDAPVGGRIALLLVGSYLFITTSSGGGMLATMSSMFRGF